MDRQNNNNNNQIQNQAIGRGTPPPAENKCPGAPRKQKVVDENMAPLMGNNLPACAQRLNLS